MSALADLPPDQRAVLQLVLKQGRSYDQLADLLGIDREAVAERARAGAEALAPDAARRLSPERRAQVADYILGQQDLDEHDATHAHLAASASARAYGRRLADVLGGEARGPLPEVPEAEGRPDREVLGDIDTAPAPAAAEPAEPTITPRRAPAPRAASADEQRVSRVGGALFMLGVAIAAAVVVILIINNNSGGDDSGATTQASTPATQTGTTTTPPPTSTAGQPKVVGTFVLSAADGSKATGGAQVVQSGKQRELGVIATNMTPDTANDAYAVWFYNSARDAFFCGFANTPVTSNGQFSVGIPPQYLPKNPRHYRQLVISREPKPTNNKAPTRPTKIVLVGVLKGF